MDNADRPSRADVERLLELDAERRPHTTYLYPKLLAIARDWLRLKEDEERLDWLEQMGNGIALLHDDFARWVVANSGFQPLTEERDGREVSITDEPIGGAWTSMVEADEWRASIREAIDAARAALGEQEEQGG